MLILTLTWTTSFPRPIWWLPPLRAIEGEPEAVAEESMLSFGSRVRADGTLSRSLGSQPKKNRVMESLDGCIVLVVGE